MSKEEQTALVYLVCHGPDGTLLTRPAGFGPTFASHALSELRSLLLPYSSTIPSSIVAGHDTNPDAAAAGFDNNNNNEWGGSPLQVTLPTHAKALEMAGQSVASELWQVLHASTVSIEDLASQLENELFVDEEEEPLDLSEPTTTLTWNLGRHSWLPSSSSSTHQHHPHPRNVKMAMLRIRNALSKKMSSRRNAGLAAVEVNTRHTNNSTTTSEASNSSPLSMAYVNSAAKADHRFAVFLFHDSNSGTTEEGSLEPTTIITYAFVVQVGGGLVAQACDDYHKKQQSRAVATMAPSRMFLTPTRPPLALLMANLACVEPGSVVLDPFCGSGSLLWGAAQAGAALCLGSDIDCCGMGETIEERKNNHRLHYSYRPPELVMCDVFALPQVLRGGCPGGDSSSAFLLDAILTDPPYGLREDQGGQPAGIASVVDSSSISSRNNGPHGTNGKRIIGARKEAVEGSQCYIEDCTGEELLESVSLMMQPAFHVAVQMLKPGGRLVYLLPLFPSQLELWGTTGPLGPEAVRHLPSTPGLDFVSAERHRCKKLGMARAIVVMRKSSSKNEEKV